MSNRYTQFNSVHKVLHDLDHSSYGAYWSLQVGHGLSPMSRKKCQMILAAIKELMQEISKKDLLQSAEGSWAVSNKD